MLKDKKDVEGYPKKGLRILKETNRYMRDLIMYWERTTSNWSDAVIEPTGSVSSTSVTIWYDMDEVTYAAYSMM